MADTCTIRNFRWDDLLPVVGVINDSLVADGREANASEAEIRYTLEHMLDAERDCFVAEVSGALAGVATMMLNPEPGVGMGTCAVAARFHGQGIGTRLLRTTDDYLLARLADSLAPDTPIRCTRVVKEVEKRAQALVEAEGYARVETRFHLRYDLSGAIPALPLPPGIALRPFDRDRHARAVYEADQEVHLEQGFNRVRVPFDEWVRFRLDNPSFAPDLWAVAWDGDEVAGVAIGIDNDPRKPQLGYVHWLGVRAPWRNRGIGRALMLHLFARFKARGARGAESHTGASNPNNTPLLAQRLGMDIIDAQHDYEKVLRGS
jgi:ribosomal protein S18 acetylase RimI-like enzyme